MESASELRKIALKKQEEEYQYNYNETIYRLDKIIEYRAKAGWTWLFLTRREHSYVHREQVFWGINKRLFKDLKKYYKEKGFRISKGFFSRDIYIEW